MNAQVLVAIPQETTPHTPVTADVAGGGLIKTRATEFIEERLNHFQNNVDDALFELAGKTRDEDLNYLYLDTISRLRNKREPLKKAFLINFEQLCQDSSSSGFAGATPTVDIAAIDKLLLSGDDSLESVIAMKNMAGKYQRRHASELSALHTAIVASQHQVLAAVSPLLLCIAWKQAVDTLKLSVKAKFVVYKLFSKFVLDELSTLYHGLLAEFEVPSQPSAPIAVQKNAPAETPDAAPASVTPAVAHELDTPIEKKLHGRKLPDSIHQFLFTVWSEVLVQVKTQKGTDSPAWTGAMQVIDDLAAVTQFKQTAQNSARLLEIIPRLLCNLQNGLSLVTYEKQKKEQLFNQLLTLHAHAIQSRKPRPG